MDTPISIKTQYFGSVDIQNTLEGSSNQRFQIFKIRVIFMSFQVIGKNLFTETVTYPLLKLEFLEMGLLANAVYDLNTLIVFLLI
jgi:hypothetical protein